MAAASSGTSARGALLLPPLARRPPLAAPRTPSPAGPGRRRRGHVALDSTAVGRCLSLSSRTLDPARPLGPGWRGRAGGAGSRLGRGGGGRGSRSRRSRAQPRHASCLRARAAEAEAGGGCLLPALLGYYLLLAFYGRLRPEAGPGVVGDLLRN